MLKKIFVLNIIFTSFVLCSAAGKSLDEMKSELKKIDEKIDKVNEDWKNAAVSAHNLKKQTEDQCKIDYSAYQNNGNEAIKAKKCEDGFFNSMQGTISRLELDQIKYEKSVDDLSTQFQSKIEEAKKTLDPRETFELLNYSNNLNNIKLKNISGKFKGEFVKSEFNRIKSEIEKSREISLTTKAITGTLNSELFCKAKENCDSKAEQKISESEVTSKIIKGISAKIAKEKTNESLKPTSKANEPASK